MLFACWFHFLLFIKFKILWPQFTTNAIYKMDGFSIILFGIAAMFMVYAAIYDWRTYHIPYVSLMMIGATGLIYRWYLGHSLVESLFLSFGCGLVLLMISLLMERSRGKAVLGYGDIQLFVMGLLWLQLTDLPSFLVLSGISGICLAWVFRWGHFPFGPGIALAWSVVILWQFRYML